jgi:hypothetical protein
VLQFAGAPVEPVAPDLVEAPAPEVPMREPMREVDESQDKWPLVGMVLPLVIFLFATWITAALHRHFSTQGH